MATDKIRSKTEEFKIALQAKASEVLGEKISKQKVWDLYKELTKLPFDFILENYKEAGKPEITKEVKLKELELPIAGIGTFKVIPVGQADRLSVKGRWYLSSTINNMINVAVGFKAEEETTEPTDSVEI